MEKLSNGFSSFEKRFTKENILPLRADEFENEEGLPICNNCKTKRYFIHNSDNKKIYFRSSCKCQEEKTKRQEDERKAQEALEKFKANQRMSALGERYFSCRFEKSEITENNKEAYEICKNYCFQWETVSEKNIGLYLYGNNSSGKTHLTACIVNKLVSRGIRVLCTSVPKMLAEIYQSFDEGGYSESELIYQISSKQLVIIDDLGKEFIGREANKTKSKFAEKILLEVLNARYNNGKPTIFSSNYSIADLKREFELDDAIMERISEMATMVIKLSGDNFRAKAREIKKQEAEKLLKGEI